MRKVLHLMGTLTDTDIDWLAVNGQSRFMPSGVTVIRQGEPIDALLILLDGRLSVRMPGREREEVAMLYPGEVLGEISFVDARPPSVTVVTLEDSHLLVVNREQLGKKLRRDDAFAARFYRGIAVFLADRLRTTTAHLGYGTAREQPADADAIDDERFDEIDLAARRFDEMLKRLRIAS
jgi:CRP-like cAMP-binding protein